MPMSMPECKFEFKSYARMSKRINATTTRHKVPHPLLSLLIEALNKHITETTTRQKSTALPFDHCLRKHIKACQSNYHTSKKYHTPYCHCFSILHMRFYTTLSSQAYHKLFESWWLVIVSRIQFQMAKNESKQMLKMLQCKTCSNTQMLKAHMSLCINQIFWALSLGTHAQANARMSNAVRNAQTSRKDKCTNSQTPSAAQMLQHQMHNCTDAQMHKCTNVPTTKCSNA